MVWSGGAPQSPPRAAKKILPSVPINEYGEIKENRDGDYYDNDDDDDDGRSTHRSWEMRNAHNVPNLHTNTHRSACMHKRSHAEAHAPIQEQLRHIPCANMHVLVPMLFWASK